MDTRNTKKITTVEHAKKQAHRLRTAMADFSCLSVCESLEMVSKMHGYRSWNEYRSTLDEDVKEKHFGRVIFFEGQSGSGKSWLAKSIGDFSHRRVFSYGNYSDGYSVSKEFNPNIPWKDIDILILDEMNHYDVESLNNNISDFLSKALTLGIDVIIIGQDLSVLKDPILKDAHKLTLKGFSKVSKSPFHK
jgi:hypothetical protein